MELQLVITTFNRSAYLKNLLASVAKLDPAPTGVVVVDNASSDDTTTVIQVAAKQFPIPLVHHRLEENVGGAGGFSAGIAKALDLGAEWIWLMDDDVVAHPDALEAFSVWMDRYRCIHGRRYDEQGKPFFWQHRFCSYLGIHLPVRGNVFASSEVFHTNVGCFEGMLVHSDVVRAIGLPDPRFFINGDDTTYGWLISRKFPVAYINHYVLSKARPQKQIDLVIRHLNDSNDLGRYCAMRNRGHIGQYLRHENAYNGWGFALGTVLTAVKEIFRLIAVEHTLRGIPTLWRGWREARRILGDTSWQPMKPLNHPADYSQDCP
ncbi:glycosyltransferase [Arthrobacter roseus]|uniref:glycosyltransferase n=1 Tax=Arthrobacter roseus TaxID=136274 RepID=UPI001964B2A2|nr:glycosyltransferase [Arthrobacter roseus]MBM7849022.1 glycosyltransferase involved in cell wall biosynthesis [Arthrobacter roseus]